VNLNDIKAAVRAESFLRRKLAFARRKPTDCNLLSERLAAEPARALAGYMPMRTEIDCLPAMAIHRGPVGVPVIVGAAQPLLFRRWNPASVMVPGAFGALVPDCGEDVEPDVLIVPLLAFDRRGYRLGYGGGFYDRTLEKLRAKKAVTAIGFAFSMQEIEIVPIEATDQKLDLIVTEREVFAPH
jgi:5-formyltetrahydrofolate cyclo-ligase